MLQVILGTQRHMDMSKGSRSPTRALKHVNYFSSSNVIPAHVHAMPYVHRHLACI